MRTRTFRKLSGTVAVAAAVLGVGGADGGAAQELRPLPGSEVVLRGRTTVGPWRCIAGGAVATIDAEAATPEEAMAGMVIRLPLTAVDCPSRGMESDLRAALRAREHPDILLRSVRVANAGDGSASVAATLGVAGAARGVSAPVRWSVDGVVLRVTGSLSLRMSDFGVEPPRAMLGIVRVRDDVVIEYDVTVNLPRSPSHSGLQALRR